MKVFLLFLSLCFSLFAQEIKIPALTSPVIDEANILSTQEEDGLSLLIRQIYNSNGPQVSILTVQNLQGYSVEEFSIRVAEKWKLGDAKKDNGLLILISKEDRKIRIEVGGGIEGEITDYVASLIIRNVITPSFKSARFYEGLEGALLEIADKFAIELIKNNKKIERKRSSREDSRGNLLILGIFILVIVHLIFQRNKKLRTLFSGLSISGLSYLLIPGIGLGIVVIFILGAILGLIGLNNLLYLIASHSHTGHYSSGSGTSWSSGDDSWSGGGGDFSGGGSSGDW